MSLYTTKNWLDCPPYHFSGGPKGNFQCRAKCEIYDTTMSSVGLAPGTGRVSYKVKAEISSSNSAYTRLFNVTHPEKIQVERDTLAGREIKQINEWEDRDRLFELINNDFCQIYFDYNWNADNPYRSLDDPKVRIILREE